MLHKITVSLLFIILTFFYAKAQNIELDIQVAEIKPIGELTTVFIKKAIIDTITKYPDKRFLATRNAKTTYYIKGTQEHSQFKGKFDYKADLYFVLADTNEIFLFGIKDTVSILRPLARMYEANCPTNLIPKMLPYTYSNVGNGEQQLQDITMNTRIVLNMMYEKIPFSYYQKKQDFNLNNQQIKDLDVFNEVVVEIKDKTGKKSIQDSQKVQELLVDRLIHTQTSYNFFTKTNHFNLYVLKNKKEKKPSTTTKYPIIFSILIEDKDTNHYKISITDFDKSKFNVDFRAFGTSEAIPLSFIISKDLLNNSPIQVCKIIDSTIYSLLRVNLAW